MESMSALNTSSFARFQQGTQASLRSNSHAHGVAAQIQDRLRHSASSDQLGAPQSERQESLGNDTLRSSIREAMSYERSEKGMLNLRTQEGDIVRLKFMSGDSVNMLSEQVTEGDRTSNSFSFESSSYSRFRIDVEGDLNAEEQKAIEDVLAQAGEMADALYSGNVQSAFAVASDFQINSEQLAKVNLRLSVQERYSYARETVTTRLAQAPQEPPAATQNVAPATTPVAAADPVFQAGNPAAQTAVAQPGAAAAIPNTVAPVAPDQPAQATGPAPAADSLAAQIDNLANALSSITDFLTQLTESLESFSEKMSSSEASSSFSFSYGFQLQIVSELVSTLDTASDDTDAPANELAAATIDELAAQVDANLDVSA